MARLHPYIPSWTEVILGAIISLVLGVVLAAAFLVLRPVAAVKELPKEGEREHGVVYYLEGSRDPGKGRESAAKRAQFAKGGSVTLNEDDINLQIEMPVAPPPPVTPVAKKPGEVVPPMEAEAKVAPPNFRIRNGQVQIAAPLKVSVFGLEGQILVLARGSFVRKEGEFVFQPETLTVGSCPLDRLPFVSELAYRKFIGSHPVPPDIAASWSKLTAVHVDGDMLKLTMP